MLLLLQATACVPPRNNVPHGAHHAHEVGAASERQSTHTDTGHDPRRPEAASPDTQAPPIEHGTPEHGTHARAQGGAAPPDARDPHAYSGGYSLENAPYSLPDAPRFRLSDEHSSGALLVHRLEQVWTDNNVSIYDVQAWFGRTYRKLVIKAEGDYTRGGLEESGTDLLYSQAVTSFWDAQVGIRYDTGDGPDRLWLALGAQGLAPYWFEIDATAYLGAGTRTALIIEVEYDLLISQRIGLQPRVEITLHGKNDEAGGRGKGLSDLTAGIRLRYQLSPRFAPYIGVEWMGKFGKTKDYARADATAAHETRYLAGLRFWF